MRRTLPLIFAAGVFLMQSCSKTEYTPQTIHKSVGGIANSTGLKLDAVGSSSLYQFIASNGSTSEVSNNSTTVGNSFDLTDYAGTPFQKWKITRVTTSEYSIQNLGSGLYLQSSTSNGSELLIQGSYNGSNTQLWTLTSIGTRAYKAVNKADGLAITANTNTLLQLQPFANLSSQTWGYNEVPGTDSVKVSTFNIASILQSNMVIQRDKPFVVWGKATPGASVSVKASWNTGVFNVFADVSGNWIASIPAAPANTNPQTLTASVTGRTPIKLTNLLIGDVWVCGGQSNMEMTVDSTSPGFFYSGITNYKQEIAAANFPLIRETDVKVDHQNNPKDTLLYPLQWTVCSPATVGPYSAIAYFFARTVNIATNVPVGIVVDCFGGSYAQEWTSAPTMQADPTLNSYYYLGSNSHGASHLYNGMINPIRNLAIKGFIWYQGESNRDDLPLSNYISLMKAMIGNWRATFNQGDLPFYYVQVAPYARDFFSTNPWGGNPVLDDYAFFREAQSTIRTVVPNSGEAITMDVGDLVRIHPYNKRPVGERLGYLALKNTYGQSSVQAVGPQYSSWTTIGSTATINFVQGTANGLNTINNAALNQFFFVAGTDHVFRQATAVISGSQMIVTAPSGTPLPIQAVRYAFTDFPITNLQNSAGLPMEPFRTDNWTN